MKEFQITDDATLEEVQRFIRKHGDNLNMGQLIQDKLEQTRWIVEAVRKEGDKALADFTARFDGVELEPAQFEVPASEIEAAMASVDPG